MATALADLLDLKHIDIHLRGRNRENALRQLIGLLAINHRVTDPEKFLQQVLAREDTSPTVTEEGVAFPHARTELVEKIQIAVGRSRFGVPFGPEGNRARLIFLIGVPQRLVNDYLVCVGALARLVKDEQTRAKLLEAGTAEEFLQVLRTPDPTTI